MKKTVLIIFWFSLSALACARHRGPEHFYFGSYSEAEKHYNKGDYEKAIEQYQAYIDENSDGNLAIISEYYIGKSHVALGHLEEAKKIFTKIEEEHPDLVWANFSKTQLKELEKPA